jgi:hypothetical protein
MESFLSGEAGVALLVQFFRDTRSRIPKGSAHAATFNLNLDLDLTLNSKAGRKSGDTTGPSTDHRENKQTLTKASRTV